ncbi:UNVERIFIED_CONTAM: hypothetical protein GTU68_055745, partial [Idotea baltica]|nr:hypothetical protein [Idotea baltica]
MAGLLCLKWNNHSLAFLNLINDLHSKELYCDATIACHGKYYPVHRMVLSTCSEYFQDIFKLTQCKHPFIIVNDIQPSELEALLNYMYKGAVNVLQEMLPSLIKAAEALKVKGLAVPDELPPEKDSSTSRKRSSNASNSQSKKSRLSEKTQRSSDENNEANSDPLVLDERPQNSDFPNLSMEGEIKEDHRDSEEPLPQSSFNTMPQYDLGEERLANIKTEPGNEEILVNVKSEPYDASTYTSHLGEEERVEAFPANESIDWSSGASGSEASNQLTILCSQMSAPRFGPPPPERTRALINRNLKQFYGQAKANASAKNPTKQLKCPYCPHVSPDFDGRVRHITNNHYESLPFGC